MPTMSPGFRRRAGCPPQPLHPEKSYQARQPRNLVRAVRPGKRLPLEPRNEQLTRICFRDHARPFGTKNMPGHYRDADSPAAAAFSIVFGPIAGRSTRRSCPGFGRLTSTRRAFETAKPRRTSATRLNIRSVPSAPSIASIRPFAMTAARPYHSARVRRPA